jgi:hypothetical protein
MIDWSQMKTAEQVAQEAYEKRIAEVEQVRINAYATISDPIFFEYQRGDKTEAEWLAAVQAVKDAHPYPETP